MKRSASDDPIYRYEDRKPREFEPANEMLFNGFNRHEVQNVAHTHRMSTVSPDGASVRESIHNKMVGMLEVKVKLVALIICLTTLSCSAQDNGENQAIQGNMVYGLPIPYMLGIHTEHKDRNALKIVFIDNLNNEHLIHEGALDGWGMRWTDKKIPTGAYLLVLSWKEDSVLKSTQRNIVLKPETRFFSLNIELANEPFRGREQNAIYLDQYTESLPEVNFKRNWNPAEQFKKDSILLPDYDVVNQHDSTIYGAYLRFSSALSINWVQSHYIAFMRFEKLDEGDWVGMRCNAPRMEMEIQSGDTGKTLDDMVLGCATDQFLTAEWYRIRIDYMLNDRIFERNEKIGNIEDNVYVEQTIYSFTDEFKIGN